MPITGWVMDSAWKDAATHPITVLRHVRMAAARLHHELAARHARNGSIRHVRRGARLIAYLVYALFVLHLAGALKHQFQGHAELQRMGIGR